MNLADLLDDLAETAAPTPVAAERLWAAGRRRRRARRVRAVLVAVAAVGVLALLLPAASVPVTPGFARSSSAGVEGHPERIGRQWFVRDLPDRPGPMAAVLEVPADDGSVAAWQAVSAHGHRWDLPQVHVGPDHRPTLSPDGRLLGYLSGRRGPYVVQDLTTGRRAEFAGIGQNSGDVRQPYFLQIQTPDHWSPDGRHLLLPGFRDEGTDARLVLLLLDVRAGTVRELDPVGRVAGWAAPDRVVHLDDRRGDAASGPVEVVQTDLAGRETSRLRLRPSAGALAPTTQWTGVVGPDDLLAMVSGRGLAEGVTGVRRFSTASGAETFPVVPVPVAGACGGTWGGASPFDLVVPELREDGTLVAQRVLVDSSERLTVVARQLSASCLVWAADAVSGPGLGGWLLGTQTGDLLFWWRELLLAALALAGLARLVRRRPHRARGARDDTGVDWYA